MPGHGVVRAMILATEPSEVHGDVDEDEVLSADLREADPLTAFGRDERRVVDLVRGRFERDAGVGVGNQACSVGCDVCIEGQRGRLCESGDDHVGIGAHCAGDTGEGRRAGERKRSRGEKNCKCKNFGHVVLLCVETGIFIPPIYIIVTIDTINIVLCNLIHVIPLINLVF